MKKNTKSGITLVEMLLVLIIGVVSLSMVLGTMRNSSQAYDNSKAKMEENLELKEAFNHISKYVQKSAYVIIRSSAGGDRENVGQCAELFDVEGKLTGKYESLAAENKVIYRNKSGVIVSDFQDVQLSFESANEIAGKIILLKVDFVEPIVTAAFVSCGMDVPDCAYCIVDTPGGDGDGWAEDNISPSFSVVLGNTKYNRITKGIDVGDGYILVGVNDKDADMTSYVIKISKSGEYVWSKSYVEQGNKKIYLNDIINTNTAGRYVAVGACREGTKERSGVVLQIDQSGNVIWSRKFRSTRFKADSRIRELYSVKQVFTAPPGAVADGFIIAGTSYNEITDMIVPASGTREDAYLLRINQDGTYKWSQAVGTNLQRRDTFADIEVLSDNNSEIYLVTGICEYEPPFGNPVKHGTWVHRFEVNRNTGGVTAPDIQYYYDADTDYYYSAYVHGYPQAFIEPAYNANRYYVGVHRFYASLYDGQALLFNIDQHGKNNSWAKSFGVIGNETTTIPKCFKKTPPDGYIVGGRVIERIVTSVNRQYTKLYLAKTDRNGDLLWSRVYGEDKVILKSGEAAESICYDAIPTFNALSNPDGYMLLGATNQHESSSVTGISGYIIKTDLLGRCPEANNPTIIQDDPIPTVINFTSNMRVGPDRVYNYRNDGGGGVGLQIPPGNIYTLNPSNDPAQPD